MVSKRATKRIHNLQFKKFRKKYKLFVAEGDRLVKDLLQQSFEGELQFKEIYALSAWLDDNRTLLKNLDIKPQAVTEKELEQITHLSTPNQVLAVLHVPQYDFSPQHATDELLMGLEFVQDPGNMGNLIRVADWYGINHILCSKNCVDAYNPKVVQATMGAIGRVKVHYIDIIDTISSINTTVYGTTLDGENIYETALTEQGVVIFGNEAKGLSAQIKEYVDQTLTIPRFGGAESLNIASSAAVVLDNFRRQQFNAKK